MAEQIDKTYQAYIDQGNASYYANRFDEALENYANALKLNNNDPMLYRNFGIIYYKQGKTELAYNNLLQSLKLYPQQTMLNYLVGIILQDSGYNLMASNYFKVELELNPGLQDACIRYGETLLMVGRAHDAVEPYKKGVRMQPTKERYSYLLSMMHHDRNSTNEHFLEIAKECYELCVLPYKQSTKVDDRLRNKNTDPNKKLKVGFISKMMRARSADYWALDVFKVMNKEEFELFFYCDNQTKDEVTHEFQDVADKWREINVLSHVQVFEMMCADQIDILIDLHGHVGGGRLELYALKPAPIQACWLNYFGTTGIPEMDYVIADYDVAPKKWEPYYVEKPYQLPQFFNPFKPLMADLPITDKIPVEINGYVTFGSFSRFSKLHDEVLAMWANIMVAVPNSRFYACATSLKDPTLCDYVRNIFTDKGIGAERLELVNQPPITEFLMKFNEVDIALDPFPFAGGSTMMDGLHMGVPTVTLNGATWVGASGASIIKSAGCPELVADTKEEYFRKVVELANDVPRLAKYRRELRLQFTNSKICKPEAFAKVFEEALRSIWTEHCSNY